MLTVVELMEYLVSNVEEIGFRHQVISGGIINYSGGVILPIKYRTKIFLRFILVLIEFL